MTDNVLHFEHYSEANGWPLEFFTPLEFACKGTGVVRLYIPFGFWLDGLRRRIGGPVYLSSAYRAPSHNAAVSDTGYNGPHTTGAAADILCHSRRAQIVLGYIHETGIRRYGINQKGEWKSRYIHVDIADQIRAGDPAPAIWTY